MADVNGVSHHEFWKGPAFIIELSNATPNSLDPDQTTLGINGLREVESQRIQNNAVGLPNIDAWQSEDPNF